MEELKVTFEDKVSIVTKPVPLINKVTDADMNQLKNKHNDTVDVLETIDGELTTAQEDILQLEQDVIDLDGRIDEKQDDLGITDETTHLLTPKEIREGADPETKLITILDLPENDAKTIGLIGGKASVISWYIPTAGTAVTFDAPRSYGSWKSPRTAFTISLPEDLTDIPEIQKTLFYLQAEELPTDLTGDKVLWSGDAFDDTEGFVNLLDITFSQEPTDDYLLLVRNTVKEIEVGPTIDPNIKVFLQFEEADDESLVAIDSSGNGNNAITKIGFTDDDPSADTRRTTGIIGGKSYLQIGSTFATANVLRIPHHSSIAIGTEFTVLMWVKINNLANRGLVSKDGKDVAEGFALRVESDGRIQGRINGSSSEGRQVFSSDVFTGNTEWTFIGASWADEVGWKIVVNDEEVGSSSSTHSIITNNTDMRFGWVYQAVATAFGNNNQMDHFRFLPTKRMTSAEMIEVYEQDLLLI
jgi:hypothetical protein